MDTSETTVHIVAPVEASIHKNEETNAKRIIRGKGMEKCLK